MNIDVRGFDSDRKRNSDDLEIDEIVCQYNIDTLKSRRRIKNREARNEKLFLAAVTAAVITIMAVLAAIGLKKEDKNFSENAFTAKDAPHIVSITDEKIAEGEQYYDDVINPNGKHK
jgi:hypothetical protein